MFNTKLLINICIVLVILILLLTLYGCTCFNTSTEGFKGDKRLKEEESKVIKMLQEGFSDQKILGYLQKNREKFDDASFEKMLNYLENISAKVGVKMPKKTVVAETPKTDTQPE